MGPGQGWALGMDGPWVWMSPYGPSGWMGLRQEWALGMDGPRKGMGRRHKWALGTDGPIDPSDG